MSMCVLLCVRACVRRAVVRVYVLASVRACVPVCVCVRACVCAFDQSTASTGDSVGSRACQRRMRVQLLLLVWN